MAHETEVITIDIQDNLARQREVLVANNQINKNINQEMTRTDRLLTQMRNREIMNKLILLSLIFLVTVSNVLVIAVKVRNYLRVNQ